jgi:hypothetical protein
MLKVLSTLAVAAALTFSAPALLTDGSAHAKSALKTCKSKVPSTGKIKSWKCKADAPCCVSHELGTYVCGQPIIGCL